jgi:Zn-dependent M28 family amino/carboxypeptidase
MINLVLIVIIILLLFYPFLKTIETFTNINYIKNFTKEISIYRPVGSSELETVKNKVLAEMKNIGLSTKVQSFKKTINNKEYSFSNLIGVNPNANKKNILLGVHIDSPQNPKCECTTDAVTGISIALQLAKNLMLQDKNYPIMLVFFDGEEAIDGNWNSENSLSGSSYFVNNYDTNLIDKVYIFDLIGGDFNQNKIAAFSNNKATVSDLIKLAKINENFDQKIFHYPNDYTSDKVVQDDHVPFINKNIYALNLIPYNFPSNHHTLNDNYDNVNWKYVEIFYSVLFEFLRTI